MLAFIRGFLSHFPEVDGSPLYLASESYGGHYIPTLARAMLAAEYPVGGSLGRGGLAGLLMGNPLLHEAYRNLGMHEIWQAWGLIPRPLFLAYLEDDCAWLDAFLQPP